MRTDVSPRILTALAIGLSMVAVALFVSTRPVDPRPDPRQTAVVGPAPERPFIEVVDVDQNGVADWKQTLPEAPDWLTRDEAASSTDIIAETHTEAVAVQMLQRMMSANMLGEFGSNTDEIAAQSGEYLASLATDELYDESDIAITSDVSIAAVRAYGTRIAEINLTHAVPDGGGELSILDRAIRSQDAATLNDLTPIVESYENIITDMLAAPVPSTYRQEHLDLVNAYNAVLTDIRAMQQLFIDPIYTLVRVQRYEDDATAIYVAISNIYLKMDRAGITWSASDTVSQFIRVGQE